MREGARNVLHDKMQPLAWPGCTYANTNFWSSKLASLVRQALNQEERGKEHPFNSYITRYICDVEYWTKSGQWITVLKI